MYFEVFQKVTFKFWIQLWNFQLYFQIWKLIFQFSSSQSFNKKLNPIQININITLLFICHKFNLQLIFNYQCIHELCFVLWGNHKIYCKLIFYTIICSSFNIVHTYILCTYIGSSMTGLVCHWHRTGIWTATDSIISIVLYVR